MYINQALHGYQQGHNKVTSSMTLSAIDEDRMKILSDWSEYAGGVDGDMSYITTYPLSQDNLFVVAKTWYADEMNRPGCVWTHSLMIDLSDIDDTFDFRQLEHYFHRPSNDNFLYDKKIEINENDKHLLEVSHTIRLQDAWLLYNLMLQNSTKSMFGIENTSAYYQYLILSLLQYLPIGIIKTLRVCSGGSTMRKDGTTEFNMIFSSLAGNTLSSLSIKNNDNYKNDQSGILYICSSLCQNNRDIYQLIRMFSNDIENNPTKLNALGILLEALNNAYKGNPNISFSALLEIVINNFPSLNEGKVLKRLFLGSKVGFIFTTEEDYYIQLCSLPDDVFDDWESIDINKEIYQYLSSSSKKFTSLIEKLVSLDSMNSEGKKIIAGAAEIVNVSMLKDLCENNWSVFMVLVSIRATLLNNDYWLSLPVYKVAILLPIVEKIEGKQIMYWDKILTYILVHTLDVSSNFVKQIYTNYSKTIAMVMDYIETNISTILPNSINELCIANQKDIICWMSEKNIISNNTVLCIMKYVSPVSKEVKEQGIEPWLAFSKVKTPLSNHGFYIYLYRLSLNWKSPIALDTLKVSFYVIYVAMSKDELSYRDFNILNPYMEELPFWQNWDNCKKLRKGIVKTMKRLDYKRRDLTDFTPSNELNATLLKIWDKMN